MQTYLTNLTLKIKKDPEELRNRQDDGRGKRLRTAVKAQEKKGGPAERCQRDLLKAK